jgi:hypothetical protein
MVYEYMVLNHYTRLTARNPYADRLCGPVSRQRNLSGRRSSIGVIFRTCQAGGHLLGSSLGPVRQAVNLLGSSLGPVRQALISWVIFRASQAGGHLLGSSLGSVRQSVISWGHL